MVQTRSPTLREYFQTSRNQNQWTPRRAISSKAPQCAWPASRALSAIANMAAATRPAGIPYSHHTCHSRGGICPGWLQAAVRLRHHEVQHRDRQHGVDARGHPRDARRLGLLFRGHLDHAEGLLLIGPDDEPDVEPHDDA